MSSSLVEEIKQACGEISSHRELSPCDFEKFGVLVDNLQLCTLRLLKEDEDRTNDSDELIYKAVYTQLSLINVPENKTVESDCEEKSYEDYKEFAERCLQNLIQLFTKITSKEMYNIPNDQLRKIVVLGLNICASHEKVYPWANPDINRLSSELLEELLRISRTSTTKELFEGREGSRFESSLIKEFLTFLLSHWKAESWKKYPANKYVFEWCLFRITFPFLFDHIGQVMPPSLLLADDLNVENKMLGVQCIHHIISNVNRSELRMYGRAEVIFDALDHLLYTPDARLLSYLLPCLIDISKVVDERPNKEIQDMRRNKCDKVFSSILYNMSTEQKIVTRRAYSEHLSSFISYMGIRIVRHLKPLLSVLFDYLDVCDSPEETTRKNSLLALKSLMKEAWPRIPAHMESVCKSLFKCVYDVETEFSKTPTPAKEEVKRDVIDCLIILRQTNQEKFKTLIASLRTTELEPIKNIVRNL